MGAVALSFPLSEPQPPAWAPLVSEGREIGVISPFSYLLLDLARELPKLRWGNIHQGKSPLGV